MTHLGLVKLVRRRMAALHMNPYQLHWRLEGTVSKQTVYNFVEHGKVIKSDTLLAVMGALGLAVGEPGHTGGGTRRERRPR